MKIQQKYIKSFDGTKIGYQVVGKGKTPFVLCNGLGGSMIAWSPIYERFYDDFKFIAWDYRGLFTSNVPDNLATLAIPYHVMDLEHILKKERVNKAIVGGWSMGVQVALELFSARPGLFAALFLINGTFGYPLKTAFNSPLTRYIVPTLNQLIKKVAPVIQPKLGPIAKYVVNRDEFLQIVANLGLAHKNLNSKIFRAIAHDILETNLAVYHEVLDQLALHDAEHILEEIYVPTLLIAGAKDRMTPHHAAEKMARKIRGAELFVLNEGSHYSLLEFPDEINQRLEQFLKEHAFLKKSQAKKKAVKKKKTMTNRTIRVKKTRKRKVVKKSSHKRKIKTS